MASYLSIGCTLCSWKIPYSLTNAEADIGHYMAHVVIKHWEWLVKLHAQFAPDTHGPSARFAEQFPDG